MSFDFSSFFGGAKTVQEISTHTKINLSAYRKISDFLHDLQTPCQHSSRGVLSMANQGPHTNKSQFFITLQPNPSLDKKYVAFGRVVSGSETLRVIESLETFNERPRTELKITDCGAI